MFEEYAEYGHEKIVHENRQFKNVFPELMVFVVLNSSDEHRSQRKRLIRQPSTNNDSHTEECRTNHCQEDEIHSSVCISDKLFYEATMDFIFTVFWCFENPFVCMTDQNPKANDFYLMCAAFDVFSEMVV